MSSIEKNYGVNVSAYDFKSKDKCVNNYIRYMLSRTQSMFTYENLPETIPQRNIELFLQVNGFAFVTMVNNNLYAFYGGQGGEYNPYYLPTEIVISNPALAQYVKKEPYKIDIDGVLMWGDSMQVGLIPMCRRYATLLTENDITIKLAEINLRATRLISASDDTTKRSADEYIKKMENGEDSIIAEGAFFDGIKAQSLFGGGGGNYLSQLIEMQQYLKASWFNELGINANYNMKRESLNSNESQLNYDSLLPLVDDMLSCRKTGVNKINKMYGTNITVDFASAWKNIQENSNRLENTIEQQESGLNNESNRRNAELENGGNISDNGIDTQ